MASASEAALSALQRSSLTKSLSAEQALIWLEQDRSILLGIPLFNLAESVRVEARTQSGMVYNLTVEYAGKQNSSPGLDQVNVILPAELKGAGSVELTVITGSLRSNTATVTIK